MRIGVTGGTGFIGGHVRDVAVERGHDVVILDRGTADSVVLPERIGDHVEWFLGDVRDSTAMTEFVAHVEGAIHLAACLGTQETIKNPFPPVETNILGGVNFLQACAQYDVPAVYIGVGNHFMNNPYSITKTTIERFVWMYNRERGTRINVVRGLNAYGPRQSIAAPFGPSKVRKVIPSFVCRAMTGAPVEVYGDGQQVSDMIYVRDVALALVVALERAAAGDIFDRPVEVGPADHTTILQVAQAVNAEVIASGYGPGAEIVHLPMRPGEIPGARVVADTSTLELVGMDPATLVPLQDGIERTVAWFGEEWLRGYQQDARALALDAAAAGEGHR